MRVECFLDESGGWLRERQVVCGRERKRVVQQVVGKRVTAGVSVQAHRGE